MVEDCIRQGEISIYYHFDRFRALAASGRINDAAVEKDRTLGLISAELGRADLTESERSLLTSIQDYPANN